MEDFNTKMFKLFIVHMLNKQDFIVDVDDQIECLMEICRDLKEEEKRQIKAIK